MDHGSLTDSYRLFSGLNATTDLSSNSRDSTCKNSSQNISIDMIIALIPIAVLVMGLICCAAGARYVFVRMKEIYQQRCSACKAMDKPLREQEDTEQCLLRIEGIKLRWSPTYENVSRQSSTLFCCLHPFLCKGSPLLSSGVFLYFI